LRQLGLELGVLSNWDSRLVNILESLNVSDLFETKTVSWEAGVEKPHPDIFKIALERSGVTAEESIMIGDVFEWDVAPSESLGMTPVWYNSDGSRPEWRGVRLDSWLEPRPLLELVDGDR
jgi:putative hydrolase of the HAD superfamily